MFNDPFVSTVRNKEPKTQEFDKNTKPDQVCLKEP
jgi:hypothetical protein